MLSVASSISLFNKFVFNKFFAIWLGLAFLVVVAVEFLEKELGKPAEAAVEFLKKKGLAEVMGQFTHTGTVLYKETENQTYIPLKGKAAIQEKLDDVKGAAFTKLLRSQDKLKSLFDAHMYVDHFEFGKPLPLPILPPPLSPKSLPPASPSPPPGTAVPGSPCIMGLARRRLVSCGEFENPPSGLTCVHTSFPPPAIGETFTCQRSIKGSPCIPGAKGSCGAGTRYPSGLKCVPTSLPPPEIGEIFTCQPNL